MYSPVGTTRIYPSPFSPISPYLVACPPDRIRTVPDREIYRQECSSYNCQYVGPRSRNPLPEKMVPLVRKELEDIFYQEAAYGLRKEHPFRLGWRRDGSMTTFNGRWLHGETFKKGHGERALIEYLNKELMVYFQHQSVVVPQDDRLGRYIYREWLRLHDGRPPFQRHSFFAKAVRFDEKGPQSLQDVSELHKSLCHRISARLDDAVEFCRFRTEMGGGMDADESPFFCPSPSERIQSWRDHGFGLGHLFRSLYIVVDDQMLTDKKPHRARLPHDDAALFLEEICDWTCSQLTVLLVKTGDESHLSSPISFQSLFGAGLALNVNRPDYEGDVEESVVRVKVDVAVRFVWDVLRSEQTALDNIGQAAQALVDEQRELCGLWTEKVMKHACENGIDENGFTWQAVRRARARLNGEAFDEDQVDPLWEHLRHWEW
jgi:hypothetical protein